MGDYFLGWHPEIHPSCPPSIPAQVLHQVLLLLVLSVAASILNFTLLDEEMDETLGNSDPPLVQDRWTGAVDRLTSDDRTGRGRLTSLCPTCQSPPATDAVLRNNHIRIIRHNGTCFLKGNYLRRFEDSGRCSPEKAKAWLQHTQQI